MIFYIIVALVLGALIIYMYKRKKKEASVSEVKTDLPNKNEIILQNLLKLNIEIRENIGDVESIESIEEVIDKIRELAPQVNERIPGSQMAWLINRMDSEYLPKLIDPYMRLDVQGQKEKKATFLTALRSIKDELKEVGEMLSQSDTENFDSKATFIQHRFSDLY